MDHVRARVFGRVQATPAIKVVPMLIHIADQPRRMVSIILSLGIALILMGCAGSDRFSSGSAADASMPSFAPVVHGVMPAVVNVSAVQRVNGAAVDRPDLAPSRMDRPATLRGVPPPVLDELLRRFAAPHGPGGRAGPQTASVALGSGFIIDPNGFVVTDNHIIENAEKVMVVVQDSTEYPARIVGRDPLTDLALLKIDASAPFSYVDWGDSDAARVGDWVLAIGNPFGLDNTVSSGIISGRGRDIHTGPYDDFLQIDAAMNRGNSGGPTFNLRGRVIGINTAIYSPNGGSVGIGFAIPANRARPVVEQLKANGKVARGWLGVQIEQVTPEIAQDLGLPKASGALVTRVGASSPAAEAGFQPGDVVLSIDGREIKRMHDLPLVIAEMPIGRMAEVTVWRRKVAIILRPVLGEMPTKPAIAQLGGSERGGRRSEKGAIMPSFASAASPAI
jgi:serine protease Do